MAATVELLRDWLETFPPNWAVYIDEGGLTLVAQGPYAGTEYTYALGGEEETTTNDN